MTEIPKKHLTEQIISSGECLQTKKLMHSMLLLLLLLSLFLFN